MLKRPPILDGTDQDSLRCVQLAEIKWLNAAEYLMKRDSSELISVVSKPILELIFGHPI